MAGAGVAAGGTPEADAGDDAIDQHQGAPHEHGGCAFGAFHVQKREDELGEYQVAEQRQGDAEGPEGDQELEFALEQLHEYAGLLAVFFGVADGGIEDIGGALESIVG